MKAFTFAGIEAIDSEDHRLVSGMVNAESAVVATVKVMVAYPNINFENLVLHDVTFTVLAFSELIPIMEEGDIHGN